MLFLTLFLSFFLCGCTERIITIGLAPETETELINKNIEDLNNKFIVVKRLNTEEYYLGSIKYIFNKVKDENTILEQAVYKLTVNDKKEVVKAEKITIQNRKIIINQKMPTLPNKGSLLSDLFTGVGSVSMI